MKGLERQKDGMVSALWANMNWDDTKDSKGHRKKAIEDINENYLDAVSAIEDAMSQRDRPEEQKLDQDNPFFAAAERGLERVEQRVKASGNKIEPQTEEKDEINYMEGLDQE